MAENAKKQWYIYIVKCADKTLYTGIAKDVAGRINLHNGGKGAKYTRARLPVKLVYTESSKNRSTATKRELQIKKLTRKEKLRLIKKDPPKDFNPRIRR